MKFRNKKYSRYIVILILSVSFLWIYVYIFNNLNLKYLLINESNLNKSFSISNIDLSSLVSIHNNDVIENVLEIDEVIKEVNYIDIEKKPIIYIYNTHQTEEYSYKELSHTLKPTVLFASYILKDYLNDYNINSYVETSSMKEYLNNNKLQYKDSYEASRYYIKNQVVKYEYYIDIHRDSSKINKTLYINDNKRYAKIMFVVGLRHNNSNSNLSFVNELNNILNKKYPGLSRGIYKRSDARFNQDISNKSILIEVGGVDNTIEEVNNTLYIFTKVLLEYMEYNNGKA